MLVWLKPIKRMIVLWSEKCGVKKKRKHWEVAIGVSIVSGTGILTESHLKLETKKNEPGIKKWKTPAVNQPEAKAASYHQQLDIAEIKAGISVPCAEIYKILSKEVYRVACSRRSDSKARAKIWRGKENDGRRKGKGEETLALAPVSSRFPLRTI